MAVEQRFAFQEPPARKECCISVVGISQNATNREVHIMFSGCEGYKRAYLAHSPLKNKTYGVVMFSSEASARRALEARAGTTWEGEDVPVRLSLGRPRTEDWSPSRRRRRNPLSPALSPRSPGSPRSPAAQTRAASSPKTWSDSVGQQPRGSKTLPYSAPPRSSSVGPQLASTPATRASTTASSRRSSGR